MELVDKKIHTSARYPHGRSIKWPRVYRALRRQGKSKSAAAAISNAHWNKYRRWGRAGMPGPKSMAERQRQQRLRKVLMGDFHVNAPLEDTDWNDDHLSDLDIEAIAEDAAEIWEVREDGTVIEKAIKGTKINGGGGQQAYDERGRYAGADGSVGAVLDSNAARKKLNDFIANGGDETAARHLIDDMTEALGPKKVEQMLYRIGAKIDPDDDSEKTGRYNRIFDYATGAEDQPVPPKPKTSEPGTVERDEGIPVGVISSYLTPEVVDAVSKASRALWKKGGETRVIVMSDFENTPSVQSSWAGAHFAGKQILLNDKALSDFTRNYQPEDVTYLTNHELAHSVDAGGRPIRAGGYLSNTRYKDMIDSWVREFDASSMGEWATRHFDDDLDREWRYATGYVKRGDRIAGRAELFADAIAFAVTPHKRKVLEDTDRKWREDSEKSKRWATPEQLANWSDPPSIVADVQQILRDLGLEEEMRKSRHTGKYGATMIDMGGDGIVEEHLDEVIDEVRKRRLRLQLGGVSILKRTIGTKPGAGGKPQEYDEFGRWTSGGRISTVPPKGKVKGKDKPHPMNELRKMSVDLAMKEDPEIAAKWMEKLGAVAGFEDLKPDASDDAKKVRGYVKKAINRIKQNILDIHDRADPKDAERWGEWYPIAQKLGAKWGKEANVHPDAVYAVMARLSPQADWNDNMTMAREVVRLLSEDPVVTKDILKAHRTLQLKQAEMYGKEPDAPLPQEMAGKRLSELSDLDAGKMVRAISDARGPLQVIDHEENPMVKEDGAPRYVRWQSNDNLMRSVSIFRNPTFENISQQMGEQHKIRAFYNNIRDPHDTDFDDVTVDTHAYGIGLGIPVTTASTEISNAKGSITLPGAPKSTKAGTVGLYPIFAEAYREAAKERGMIGRRMQSITWEQWRKEWSPRARSPWMVDTARNIQHDAAKGTISREESWKLLEEFRAQLPGAEGGGTNKEESITGRAARYVPSRYDGKIDKARDVQDGPGWGILNEDEEQR